MNDEQITLIFMPALVDMLRAAEAKKAAPLSEDEVIAIRGNAICMTVRVSVAREMADRRGYPDIDPANVWEDWQAVRKQV